jgi:hypothetical protein
MPIFCGEILWRFLFNFPVQSMELHGANIMSFACSPGAVFLNTDLINIPKYQSSGYKRICRLKRPVCKCAPIEIALCASVIIISQAVLLSA